MVAATMKLMMMLLAAAMFSMPASGLDYIAGARTTKGHVYNLERYVS